MLILQNTIYIAGEKKDPLKLTESELEKIKNIIKPHLDIDFPAKEPQDFLFYLFKVYYQRDYEDAMEEARRFEIFKSNTKLISEINSQEKSFSVGINKFADREEMEVPKGLIVTDDVLKASKEGFEFSEEIQKELETQFGGMEMGEKEKINEGELPKSKGESGDKADLKIQRVGGGEIKKDDGAAVEKSENKENDAMPSIAVKAASKDGKKYLSGFNNYKNLLFMIYLIRKIRN